MPPTHTAYPSIPFGKYELLERVAVGGMAEVYRARLKGEGGFEKYLVIKRILPHLSNDAEFVHMLIDEAKIAGCLYHPNIIQIYDLGKIDGTYYIAMEYIEGGDLKVVLRRCSLAGRPFPIPQAILVITEVLKGLEYAHLKTAAGREARMHLQIIHRDVSPPNILISYEGEVKLVDFGIAKAATRVMETSAGILKGKFEYMSPEQASGLALDSRTDLFSTAIVLYEMLTGRNPFAGETEIQALNNVRNSRVVPPRQLNPGIPLRLQQIILKGLMRDPDDRYSKASDMRADLLSCAYEEGVVSSASRLAQFMNDLFQAEMQAGRPASNDQNPLAPRSVVALAPREIPSLSPLPIPQVPENRSSPLRASGDAALAPIQPTVALGPTELPMESYHRDSPAPYNPAPVVQSLFQVPANVHVAQLGFDDVEDAVTTVQPMPESNPPPFLESYLRKNAPHSSDSPPFAPSVSAKGSNVSSSLSIAGNAVHERLSSPASRRAPMPLVPPSEARLGFPAAIENAPSMVRGLVSSNFPESAYSAVESPKTTASRDFAAEQDSFGGSSHVAPSNNTDGVSAVFPRWGQLAAALFAGLFAGVLLAVGLLPENVPDTATRPAFLPDVRLTIHADDATDVLVDGVPVTGRLPAVVRVTPNRKHTVRAVGADGTSFDTQILAAPGESYILAMPPMSATPRPFQVEDREPLGDEKLDD